MRVFAMELFTKLFGDLLLFVYHCFERIVIHGYLSGLSRPEQVVHETKRYHEIDASHSPNVTAPEALMTLLKIIAN